MLRTRLPSGRSNRERFSFGVLEVFKNGSPFFSLFLVPYWNEEPSKKTKTPFLFLFLTSLLERPQRLRLLTGFYEKGTETVGYGPISNFF